MHEPIINLLAKPPLAQGHNRRIFALYTDAHYERMVRHICIF